MIAGGVLAQLQEQAEVAGARGVAAAAEAIAAAAVAELPGVGVAVVADGVVLTGPGLVARAFGSRTVAADARLTGLLAGGWR